MRRGAIILFILFLAVIVFALGYFGLWSRVAPAPSPEQLLALQKLSAAHAFVGTNVVVYGSGFDEQSSILLRNAQLSFVVRDVTLISSSELSFIVPDTLLPGTYLLTVRNRAAMTSGANLVILAPTIPGSLPVCGDGIVRGAEQCDDGNKNNGDGCSSACQLERQEHCGNGVYNPGETCDDGNKNNGDGCSSTCQIEFCGDGVAQLKLFEECDGSDFGIYGSGIGQCTSYDASFTSGDLSCAACHISTAGCQSGVVCGNGIREELEQCDGTDLDDTSCGSIGYTGGTLACSTSCVFDTSGCTSSASGDSAPPTITLFTAVLGYLQATLTYAAFDPDPPTYPLLYSLVRSTDKALLDSITITNPNTFLSTLPPGATAVKNGFSTGPLSRQYVDVGLSSSSTYYYRFFICDGVAGPPYNCIASASSGAFADQSDTQPPTITAFAAQWGDKKVTISYAATDPSPPSLPLSHILIRGASKTLVDGVQLKGSSNSFDNPPGGVTKIIPDGTGIYVDTGVTNGVTYYYRLRACDAAVPADNCASTTSQSSTPHFPVVSFSIGAQEMVFDYTTDKCTIDDNPDLSARALHFNGQLFLYAGADPQNYISKGTTFAVGGSSGLKRVCSSVALTSSDDDFASTHNNREWIASVYTTGGKIHALVHNEYHDPFNPSICGSTAKDAGNPCWYNTITTATSTDGFTFTQLSPPSHVAFAPAQQWNAQTMGQGLFGPFESSNIIKKDGFYYAYALVLNTPGSPYSYVCAYRTANLNDPSSWRAWDGKGFTLSTGSPYVSGSNTPCAQLDPNLQTVRRSVTYSTAVGKYMIVDATTGWVGSQFSCGFWYSLSDDLITWSPIAKFMAIDLPYGTGAEPNCLGRNNLAGKVFYQYLSLIDHDELSNPNDPNFEIADNTFFVYSTRHNSGWTLDRDLVRWPVTITVT